MHLVQTKKETLLEAIRYVLWASSQPDS